MTPQPTYIEGWWFAPTTGVLAYGDGRRPEVGVTHTVTLDTDASRDCAPGLYCAEHAIDALAFRTDGSLWRVRIGPDTIRCGKKARASERTYLREIPPDELTPILRWFARWCALEVAHLWDCPDVVARWLVTGDPALRSHAYAYASAAASAYAYAAADAASWLAASSASDAAASDAAASWLAASSAASAASDAASAASDAASAYYAYYAARQNAYLSHLLTHGIPQVNP